MRTSCQDFVLETHRCHAWADIAAKTRRSASAYSGVQRNYYCLRIGFPQLLLNMPLYIGGTESGPLSTASSRAFLVRSSSIRVVRMRLLLGGAFIYLSDDPSGTGKRQLNELQIRMAKGSGAVVETQLRLQRLCIFPGALERI
eukprot:6369824-Amphidinium_carterae.1